MKDPLDSREVGVELEGVIPHQRSAVLVGLSPRWCAVRRNRPPLPRRANRDERWGKRAVCQEAKAGLSQKPDLSTVEDFQGSFSASQSPAGAREKNVMATLRDDRWNKLATEGEEDQTRVWEDEDADFWHLRLRRDRLGKGGVRCAWSWAEGNASLPARPV